MGLAIGNGLSCGDGAGAAARGLVWGFASTCAAALSCSRASANRCAIPAVTGGLGRGVNRRPARGDDRRRSRGAQRHHDAEAPAQEQRDCLPPARLRGPRRLEPHHWHHGGGLAALPRLFPRAPTEDQANQGSAQRWRIGVVAS